MTKEDSSRQIKCWEEALHCDGAEALEQGAQKSCGCPNPVHCQVDGGFEHPGLVKSVPAQGIEFGTR